MYVCVRVCVGERVGGWVGGRVGVGVCKDVLLYFCFAFHSVCLNQSLHLLIQVYIHSPVCF